MPLAPPGGTPRCSAGWPARSTPCPVAGSHLSVPYQKDTAPGSTIHLLLSTLEPDCNAGQEGNQAVSAFHRRLKPRPAEAFLSVRALAHSLGPDVVEKVDATSVCYMRRDSLFLKVQAVKSRLVAVFPPHLALADPMGRLLKRGDEKYAPLDSPEGLDGHVQEFIRKAYAAARKGYASSPSHAPPASGS